MSEAQKRAKKKYFQKKTTRLTIDFYPTEKELVEQIEKQPKKQTYIKNLIREDLEREKRLGRLGGVVTYERAGIIHYKCPVCETVYAYIKEGHTAPCECKKCGAKMDN